MITWDECSIDWADATTIAKVTHVPSGISVDGPFEDDDAGNRFALLDQLNNAVEAAAEQGKV